ncbi:MAG: hypothetical protein ACRDRH_14065 [Pseudonocardia sp.]
MTLLVDHCTIPAAPVSARPLPEAFALVDINPLTSVRYQDSRYRDLPPYVVAVIGVTQDAWDGLVHAGSVGLVFDAGRVHSLVVMVGDCGPGSGWYAEDISAAGVVRGGHRGGRPD